MKTHFADDATLAHIARLERDRAELIEALRKLHASVINPDRDVISWEAVDSARALLSRLGAK